MAKTPEELLAEAMTKIAEKDAALVVKDALIAEKIAEIAAKDLINLDLSLEVEGAKVKLLDQRKEAERYKLESEAKEDKQAAYAKAEGQVANLRLALGEAQQIIEEQREELAWRREAMGDPVPEPQVGPPAGPQPELPEHERRQDPWAIVPGKFRK